MIDEVNEIDKGLFRHLVYGVIENLYYIDFIIKKYTKNKIDKNIINILRIAIYELVFLNTKNYAVINEAVNNTKKINFRAKGFVNGVLRNIDRNLDYTKNIEIKDFKSEEEYLSVKYSTNLDIVKYIKNEYKNYEAIISSFVMNPSLSIRVNTYLTTKDELKYRLKSKNIEYIDSKISKYSLIIKNPINITELEEFKEGLFTIQDEASSLVGEILSPKNNSLVLDLCAAPGSKSTHLLQLMNNTGKIYSNDISEDKINKIKENFDRMKLSNYKITNYDASLKIDDFINKFDYILVDAPCSGLGVIKRKPEIKLNRKIEDILSLANIQKQILENAYFYLKKGGELVYSTCTLGDIENQKIIYEFLNNHQDLKLIKIDDKDYIEILPNESSDGFFIAKILKK